MAIGHVIDWLITYYLIMLCSLDYVLLKDVIKHVASYFFK